VPVNGSPISPHECAYKQQERALGLMEIGDEHIRDAEAESRNDDYPGTYFKFRQVVPVQVIYKGIQRLRGAVLPILLVRDPLLNVGRFTRFNAAYTCII